MDSVILNWRRNIYRLRLKVFKPEKFSRLQKSRFPLEDHRCIFVHVPKCAGISVGTSLFGQDFAPTHRSLNGYLADFGPKDFQSYLKFTVVRNPYDRLASAYFFLKKGGINEEDKNWAEKILLSYDSFDAFVKGWVNKKNIQTEIHFRPQCDFICLESNRPGVDFIGYYENLAADFQHICRKINSNSTLLAKNRNANKEKDFRAYYTEETKAIVADVYADDIRVLGYAFGNSSLQNQLAMRDRKVAQVGSRNAGIAPLTAARPAPPIPSCPRR